MSLTETLLEKSKAVFTREENFENRKKSMYLAILEKDSPSRIYLKNSNEKTMQLITPAKL